MWPLVLTHLHQRCILREIMKQCRYKEHFRLLAFIPMTVYTRVFCGRGRGRQTICRLVLQFATDDKGYIGFISTITSNGSPENDFWEYNPLTDSWLRKQDYPGRKSSYPLASFVISGKGYVALPDDYNDVWQYDPSTNTWSQKKAFQGTFRAYPVSFTIGNKGYLGTGDNGSFVPPFFKDFWEFQL